MKFQHICHSCGRECKCTHPKDVLLGIVLGGVIGATTALLLAPKSGPELRQDISDKFQEISENTQDFASSIQEEGQRFAKNASSQATSWVEKAYNVVDELTSGIGEIKEKASAGKKQFSEKVESSTSEAISDILDWATLGLRLLQSAKKRR